MLIRVGLAIDDRSIQKYLERTLAYSDVRVESFGSKPSVQQKIVQSGCDVIVISETLILRPVDNGIESLNALPESPTIIIIHGSDSPEEHARLSGAGADVVLFAGISKRRMVEAIEAALESRRQFIQPKKINTAAISIKVTIYAIWNLLL